jgi:hypothetical protein
MAAAGQEDWRLGQTLDGLGIAKRADGLLGGADLGLAAANEGAGQIPGGAFLVGGLSLLTGLVLKRPGEDKRVGKEKEDSYNAGLEEGKRLIMAAIKGDKPTTHIYPDVISTAADENLTHGAQKPVALYQNLLQRSVKPGDRVADFFAGSGTIFEAAHGMKCYAVGTEQSPEYYGMSLARIKRLKQLETPDIFEGL